MGHGFTQIKTDYVLSVLIREIRVPLFFMMVKSDAGWRKWAWSRQFPLYLAFVILVIGLAGCETAVSSNRFAASNNTSSSRRHSTTLHKENGQSKRFLRQFW